MSVYGRDGVRQISIFRQYVRFYSTMDSLPEI